jgi:hypothetical protein
MLPTISGTTADGQMTYTFVADIRQVWPVVRPGIEQIIATNREPYIPEDVYRAIADGSAAMYLVHKVTGEYSGFSVLTPHFFPFGSKPDLNLWLGYTTDKATGHYGIEISKAVQQAAGFDRLVFATPQEGWPERYATKLHTWYEVN